MEETYKPLRSTDRLRCTKCGRHAQWKVSRQSDRNYRVFYACRPEHF